jgi:hypothetical protein
VNSAHTVAAVIGIALTLAIIYLVRADHISPKVAARWFLLALLVLTVSLAPEVVDWIGEQLGIGYPPVLPILVAISVAMVKILIMDIERQSMQVKLDRLVQKVSIFETILEGQKNNQQHKPISDNKEEAARVVSISNKKKQN